MNPEAALTVGNPALWIGFTVLVLGLFALDLGVFHRKTHVVGFREALGWSVFWIALALSFNVGVYYWFGSRVALEFLVGVALVLLGLKMLFQRDTSVLVLCRKIGEEIVLPNQDVKITVIAVKGKRVKLGVSAPTKVTVLGSELLASNVRDRTVSTRTSTAPAAGNGVQ